MQESVSRNPVRACLAHSLLTHEDTNRFVNMAGNESSITVNVVSTFLLGLLLLPKLRESGHHFNMTPTVTVVSSEVHHFTEVRFISQMKHPVLLSMLTTGSSLSDTPQSSSTDSTILKQLACASATSYQS